MITITDTDLEFTLKTLLQKKVCFIINRKQWRTGRLLLFKQNGFYIEFTLKNNKNKTERFEVPIPFEVEGKQDKIRFSYKFDSLICNNSELVERLKNLEPNCRSRYYDNYMEIRVS